MTPVRRPRIDGGQAVGETGGRRASAARQRCTPRVVICDNRLMDAATDRRNRMEVRVYPSLAAHDKDDARFWATMSVEERVLQVWKLSEAQWRLSGEFPDASGLPRSVARVHRP
jgi:hypothetical protein